MRVDSFYITGNETQAYYSPSLEGASEFISTRGVFNISGISFTGTPGS